MSVFLDTNILIYAILHQPGEEAKRDRARELLRRTDVVLSVQTLNEFTFRATNPKRGRAISLDEAVKYVSVFRRFPVQDLTLDIYDEATRIHRSGRFSWWDALIVAAARAQGCDILYSEDMQDGRIIDRLRIVNPFA